MMRRRSPLLLLLTAGLVATTVITLAVFAWATYPIPDEERLPSLATTQVVTGARASNELTATPIPCARIWAIEPAMPSPADIDRCGIEKQTKVAQVEREEATAAMRAPTLPPLPTSLGTPIPPGYIPEEAKRIYQVNAFDNMVIPILRNAPSQWHVGAVAGSDEEPYNHLYLYAKPKTASNAAYLGMLPFGNSVGEENYRLYMREWFAPETVQTITIANVLGPVTSPTGPIGTVVFTTAMGQSGSFDLATGTWTVDGVVWVAPTPTVVPVAVPYPDPAYGTAGQEGGTPTRESPLNQTANAHRTRIALHATHEMQTTDARTPQPQPTVDWPPTLTAWALRPRIWPTPNYGRPSRPLGTGTLVEGGSLQDPNLWVKTKWDVITGDNLRLLVFTGAFLDGTGQESLAPGFIVVRMFQIGDEGTEVACCGGWYLAPTRSGALRIVDVDDMTLKLQTGGGEVVHFDVRLRQFLDAAGVPILIIPTLVPTPTGLPYPGPVELPTLTATLPALP